MRKKADMLNELFTEVDKGNPSLGLLNKMIFCHLELMVDIRDVLEDRLTSINNTLLKKANSE